MISPRMQARAKATAVTQMLVQMPRETTRITSA